jgi:hypothetical protein
MQNLQCPPNHRAESCRGQQSGNRCRFRGAVPTGTSLRMNLSLVPKRKGREVGKQWLVSVGLSMAAQRGHTETTENRAVIAEEETVPKNRMSGSCVGRGPPAFSSRGSCRFWPGGIRSRPCACRVRPGNRDCSPAANRIQSIRPACEVGFCFSSLACFLIRTAQ